MCLPHALQVGAHLLDQDSGLKGLDVCVVQMRLGPYKGIFYRDPAVQGIQIRKSMKKYVVLCKALLLRTRLYVLARCGSILFYFIIKMVCRLTGCWLLFVRTPAHPLLDQCLPYSPQNSGSNACVYCWTTCHATPLFSPCWVGMSLMPGQQTKTAWK